MYALRNRSRMVPKVSEHRYYFWLITNHITFRCMAPCKDLEQDAISRTQKLADELAEFHELGELWAKFGIVGDIVVRGNLDTL